VRTQEGEKDGKIHDRLYQEHTIKKQVKDWNQEFKEMKEVESCTFRPQLVSKDMNVSNAQPLSPTSSQTFKRLYTKDVQKRTIQHTKRANAVHQEELEECTFHPTRVTKNKDKKFLNSGEKDKENVSHFERLYMNYKTKADNLEQKKQHKFESNSNAGASSV
jgi:hypothetical protein